MNTFLILGFLMGMRHALDADHLAAVATLATRSGSTAGTIARGAAWGLGHTLTLLLVGGTCLLLSIEIPERSVRLVEAGVGVMLIGLGAEVFWRMRRRGIHAHAHRHADGTVHIHAHQHSREAPEADQHDPHDHPHPQGLPRRAVLVGMMHGLAGTAAILLLTVQALLPPWLGLVYIGVFGLGSILGMAALSAVIALPLHLSARRLTRAYVGLEGLIGLGTIAIGVWVIAGVI
jgi:ABC-type nickel/cobalt efflux system permease component RcnA